MERDDDVMGGDDDVMGGDDDVMGGHDDVMRGGRGYTAIFIYISQYLRSEYISSCNTPPPPMYSS